MKRRIAPFQIFYRSVPFPRRHCPAVFGGTDRQRLQDVAAQAPGVGMANVIDPTLDAGVELDRDHRSRSSESGPCARAGQL